MAEYLMQESNLPNEEGKRVMFPRMKLWGQVSQEEIVKNIVHASSFTEGDVNGLITALANEIARSMAQGYSVKIEGLGVFSPSLGLREGKERESGEKGDSKRNAQSIYLSNIRFRADKRFISNTARRCMVERSKQQARRSSTRYTAEERLGLAQNYLANNPLMTVNDYCELTGLLRTTASLELKRWAADAESGIGIEGRGTHRVYVKKTTT